MQTFFIMCQRLTHAFLFLPLPRSLPGCGQQVPSAADLALHLAAAHDSQSSDSEPPSGPCSYNPHSSLRINIFFPFLILSFPRPVSGSDNDSGIGAHRRLASSRPPPLALQPVSMDHHWLSLPLPLFSFSRNASCFQCICPPGEAERRERPHSPSFHHNGAPGIHQRHVPEACGQRIGARMCGAQPASSAAVGRRSGLCGCRRLAE